MNQKKIIFFSCILFFVSFSKGIAQKFAVKTNLPYLATATFNLAAEVSLSDKFTLELGGGFNPFYINKDDNKKIIHWMAQPELRYWFCEKFNRHFIGLHAIGGEYNISGVDIPTRFNGKISKDHRYEGWGVGAGLSYGYQWILSNRWNIEFTVGAGYLYTEYGKADCYRCAPITKGLKGDYFGITKAGLSLVYFIK